MVVSRLASAGLVAAILCCVACSSPARPAVATDTAGAAGAGPPPLERLTIPFSQLAAGNAPLFIAADGGIFERNGLDVDLVNLGSGQPAQAALVSGQVDLTASSGPSAVNAIASGANVVVVGVITDTLPYQLIASPDVRSVADLRGTTLGINRLGGLPHVVLRFMLRAGGVDADQDLRVIQLGEQPERLAALRTGAIQGTLVGPPYGTIAEREGLRLLADSAELGLAYPNGVLTMNRDWLRTHRDTARRVLQSLLDAKRAFRTDRELAVRALQHWLQVDDPTLLADMYDYFSRIAREEALPRPEGVQRVIDEVAAERPEARSLRPEDVVDTSLAAELR